MRSFDFTKFVSLWGENYGLWCTLVDHMETPEAAAMLRCAARAFGGLETMAAGTLARALKRDAAAGKAATPPAIEPVAMGSIGRLRAALAAAQFPMWRQQCLEDWAALAIGNATDATRAAAAVALLSYWGHVALDLDMGSTEAFFELLELSYAATNGGGRSFL